MEFTKYIKAFGNISFSGLQEIKEDMMKHLPSDTVITY